LEEKHALNKELTKWKKRLEDALKRPEKAMVNKKNKPVHPSLSQSSHSVSFAESFSSDLEDEGSDRQSVQLVESVLEDQSSSTLTEAERSQEAVSIRSLLLSFVTRSHATLLQSRTPKEPTPPSSSHQLLFEDELAIPKAPPIEILERGYSQELSTVSIRCHPCPSFL
jgi:hypothetical protein